jgi:hypothetical protein
VTRPARIASGPSRSPGFDNRVSPLLSFRTCPPRLLAPDMGVEILQTLLQQANATGSKSTVLQPLIWILCAVLGAVTATAASGPFWLSVCLAIFAGLLVATLVGAYIYFAFTNPDYLRSERFNLSKLQIEKNLLGDSAYGFTGTAQTKTLSVLSAGQEESTS